MHLGRLTSMLLMLPLATARIAAADLSGNWTIDGDVQGNPVNLTCVVQQGADLKVAGKCQVNGMEATEIDGTAKDAAFKFSFTVQGYTLTYSGTVEGNTMTGDIEVAGATGKFSGKRS
jgi:hypothetical protein